MSKIFRTPDLIIIQDMLNIIRTEAKERAEETSTKAMVTVKVALRNDVANLKLRITMRVDTRAAAEEAIEKGRRIVEVVTRLKDKTSPLGDMGISYAAAAANERKLRECKTHTVSTPSSSRPNVESF